MPKSSTSDKPLGFKFNAKNREAQRIAREYAAEQVQDINGETERALRNAIADSIRDQIPPREAAKLIRDKVGLNRPQQQAVSDYTQSLPVGLPQKARTQAIKKYTKKLNRRRALMIARTEVIDALNLGAEVAWKQAQSQGLLGKEAHKEWVTTPVGACLVCEGLNGRSVPIDESFGVFRKQPLYRPTAHPNCRCGLAPTPGEGEALPPTTRIGITSYRPTAEDGGDFTNLQTYRRMREFEGDMGQIAEVFDVQVRPAVGAWKGDSEPSWAVSYRGNGEARQLAAQYGEMFNQDSVLMMFESDEEDRNGITMRMTFEGAIAKEQRTLITDAAGDAFTDPEGQSRGGWTWSKREGNTQLTMTSVEQWGVTIQDHREMVSDMETAIREETDLPFRVDDYNVITEVLDSSNYKKITSGQ